jgi:cytosine/adenosine deaminase-related metal-dependent hydrolase
MRADLLIEGATVVTVDAAYSLHEEGFVAVKDGAILAVGAGAAPAELEAARRVDGRGCVLMPGFVNTHTHVAMAAFRGAGEDREDRLTRFLFPMEKALVDRDLVREASAFCLAEMALSGTTTFADMYYFEDEVARATEALGLRAVLGETIVDFPAPDSEEAHGGFDYAKRFIAEWSGHPLITPCFAPHAPYTVDAEVLAAVGKEAARLGSPVLMHVAEAEKEAARFKASHGSVVRYLEGLGLLDPRLVAAHAIYLDEGDIALLARRGAAIAHCPSSNAKSGRPIAPARACVEAGIRLGLATDGPVSGNGMDMEGVLGLYPKLQKVLAGRREVVTCREALRAATLGGAEALGLGDVTGSIEPGKRADLVLVDAGDYAMQPVYDWYSALVYSMRPHAVRSVWVDGKAVVEERVLCRVDAAGLGAAMARIAGRCRNEIARLTEVTR